MSVSFNVVLKTIVNTKEYANVNESDYFNMSKKLLRISDYDM